ncbi:MAG TPA: HutD family protein [Xanthobacteraceae bacterium]|nr:HutD family protein [Xanthobacteraceae bacterium]
MTRIGLMPRLERLTPADYRDIAWKNGGGVTSDILLYPQGASHEDFDIRVSLAPIVAAGPFSSFPGIDRHITLLSGNGLVLVFETAEHALARLSPFYFDSVLAPVSRLNDGPVRVLNVMTRRGRWNAQVMAISASGDPLLTPPEGGHAVLYAVAGLWQVSDGDAVVRIEPGDTLLSHGDATLRATCEPGGEAVVAFLSPAFMP